MEILQQNERIIKLCHYIIMSLKTHLQSGIYHFVELHLEDGLKVAISL